MKVKVKVFSMVKEKGGLGKNNKTVFEQSAQLLQGDDGYPDCPCVVTHWDDRKLVLAAGLYTADLFFEPAPYGQMVPTLYNFQAETGSGAQRPTPARLAS